MDKNEISRITSTLGKDENSYYVYMLCEKINGHNKPFYIGKGKGDRLWQHEKDAAEAIEKKERQEEILLDKSLSYEEKNALKEEIEQEITAKYTKINQLGERIVKVIVKWGLTKDEAFMAESSLINSYTLTNGCDSLTNIVNGHMSYKERDNISCTTKARKVEDFLNECAIQKQDVTEITEPALFVKIQRLYPKCMKLSKDEQVNAIYDSCRACWNLSEDRIEKIKYVFALSNSQVVGIYSVDKSAWKQRLDIDDSFPKFPIDERQLEIDFAMIAKKCSSISEMKEKYKNFNDFIRIAKINKDDEKGFKAWKSRYYFNKLQVDIPESIKKFQNCILVKPNGDRFFSGRGNQSERMYNFDIKKGVAVIRDKSYYRKDSETKGVIDEYVNSLDENR